MSETPPPPPPHEAAFFTAIRSWDITRGDHGVLGGVVEGVGNRISLARVPARIIVVVLAIVAPGIMLLAYAAAWALLPARSGSIIIQDFGRGVTNVGALIGIAVMGLLGLITMGEGPFFGVLGLGDNLAWTGSIGMSDLARLAFGIAVLAIPLTFVGGIIALIVVLVRRNSNSATSTQPGPDAAAASERTPSTHGSPHLWEEALRPGDPRAGAAPSRGATASTPAPAGATAAPRRPTSPSVYVPGPGRGGYLGMLGAMVLIAAVVAALERADRLAVAPPLAWLAASIVALGLILVLVGASGRRTGFLGFVSVIAVIVGVLLSANSGDLRSAYDRATGAIEDALVSEEVYVEDEAWVEDEWFDPVESFAGDYSEILFSGECNQEYSDDPADWSIGSSRALLALGDVTADTEVEVTAAVTTLRLPEGTSLEVLKGPRVLTVVWSDRDVACDFYEDTDRSVGASLINVDSPVVTLRGPEELGQYDEYAPDDWYGHRVVIIEEVAS